MVATLSLDDLFIWFVQLLIVVVGIQAVLVDQVRDRWLESPFLNTQHPYQELLILLDGAEEDLPDYFAVLILADDGLDGLCILLPHLKGNERWIRKHKIKEIMVFLRDGFGVIEVILIIIGVVLLELDVILYV